jgi:uroporphyrin-III C-methyltransferase
MPAAIIHQASLPGERMVRGTVAHLPELASAHQLTHPSIIIIGPVVQLGTDIKMQATDTHSLQLKII